MKRWVGFRRGEERREGIIEVVGGLTDVPSETQS